MSEEGRLDLEEIRALIRLATEAEITELFVDAPHVKVRIRKGDSAPSPSGSPEPVVSVSVPRTEVAAPPGAPVVAPPTATGYVPIVAPMVGTFYRAPKPDAAPFVSEGDQVEPGQIVCILEAMKLFNEIPSDVAGRIVRILVENGAPVEFGQPLFLVDPSAA
ncbi:MAG TPA: acetyl-CoA carboxylase biotin carboxyl carrier protein [bacterium]|nr:acetyl-CoA carboxylase biotin carboxyl carrier protein [bacterium]